MNNARDAYLSQPVFTGAVYEELEKVLKETCEKEQIEEYKILSPQYSNGTISFSVTCDANK